MFGLALALAAVTGFVALSYEIVWYRIISIAMLGVPSAFGLLLAAYLLGIAFGSRESRRFCHDDAKRGDLGSLRSLGMFFFAANVVSFLVVPLFARSLSSAPWMIVFGFVGVLVAAGMMGAVLPLLCHFAIAPDERAGQRLSYVYFANIIGSTLGSLLTGFVFLDVMTLAHTCLALVVLGSVVSAATLATASAGPARSRVLGASALGLVVIVLVAPFAYSTIYERMTYRDAFDPAHPLALVIENKSGVIAVTGDGTVYGGGAYDGRVNTNIAADRNGIIRAYAVGALHPAPRKVLMIGLASGSWAQVIASSTDVTSLRVVEINPGYLDLVSRFPDVSSVLTNPKVTIVIDDGRRWLHRNPDERFDFIVMNTTWHWRAHITNLLSREFLELARAHLAPGGVFYYNTTQSADAQKTAMTVFPYGLRFFNFVAVSDSPVTFDPARFAALLKAYRIDGRPVLEPGSADEASVLTLVGDLEKSIDQPEGRGKLLERRERILERTADATVVTDDNMAVEFTSLDAMLDTNEK